MPGGAAMFKSGTTQREQSRSECEGFRTSQAPHCGDLSQKSSAANFSAREPTIGREVVASGRDFAFTQVLPAGDKHPLVRHAVSTPIHLKSVRFHHQFTDPGISAAWKLAHTITTYAVVYPSLVTAFTVIASLEIAGRMKGATGLFNWIGRLPSTV